MRKTKKLNSALKALVLIFAVCFMMATQGHAQNQPTFEVSPNPATQSAQSIQSNNIPSFGVSDFFEWLNIVTTDMTVIWFGKRKPPVQSTGSNTTEAKRIGSSGTFIVTTDMSVRDGGY